MNAKLPEAAALFTKLGWEDVTLENVLELPIGTPEQKRIALEGLKSGDFGEYLKVVDGDRTSWQWQSFVETDLGKLALFAIAVGVSAQRAVSIVRNNDPETLTKLIASRGAKYATDFITAACVSQRRMWEHSASAFGNVAVRLADELDLNVLSNVDYLKDWAVYAALALGLKAEIPYKESNFPGADMIERRFVEHIQAGVAFAAPATGPFGAVLPAGVKRGWLDQKRAITLVFQALDAAVRPGDRKVWLNVLDELETSNEEFYSRAQSLIPLLATGDTAVVTRLAPLLLAQATDELLTETLLAALSATTKKARQLVLKAALQRPAPNNAEELTSWLQLLASENDRTIAALATKLAKQWAIETESPPQVPAEAQGLWQDTPPVWQVPVFELGEVSPKALTELAAQLVNRAAVIHDVLTERFIAVANAVAGQDTPAARTSLRGLRTGVSLLLNFLTHWVKEEKPTWGFDTKEDTRNLLHARDYVVALGLGELPCLLSTPSYEDLTVTLPDLIKRLSLYQQANVPALEADLQLALCRLEVKTSTPECIQALEKITVPILLQSGKQLGILAAQAIAAYLDHPLREPAVAPEASRYFYGEWISGSEASLPGFPNRFDRYLSERLAVMPVWGDTALQELRWSDEVYHEVGLLARQAARRSAPLPPGGAINLLAIQRSFTPDAAEDAQLAVSEAWQRGLLRPGVADVALLDWTSQPPYNLAALSTALEGVAGDGLLSVVWPVLDALVTASLKAPRLLAGTAELAELTLRLLPEVQFAVQLGKADATALELPGIRALAARGGSSRAVGAAQQLVAQLPASQEPKTLDENAAPTREMEIPFDEVWSPQAQTQALAPLPAADGVTLTVDWADPNAKTRLFCFTLTLPDIPSHVFQIVNQGWCYDLESEGQCNAYLAAPDAASFAGSRQGDKQNRVWLHWDESLGRVVVAEHRNWVDGTDGPLKGTKKPPLPPSFLTVLIGLLAQDGDAVYYAPRLVRQFIREEQLGAAMVRQATQILLQSPVVSPAKLVRALEKDIKLLPTLWPMLTECIKFAGDLVAAGEKPPVWVNRVLDVSLLFASYLLEASKRGLIPAADAHWTGLACIAEARAKSAAVEKARKLVEVFSG